MRKDKLEFTLDVVSGIDEEIVDRHLTKRYKLSQRRGKRSRVALISLVAALLSICLVVGAFMIVPLFGKQVPVYQGMTVSNQAPVVPASELALPEPMISLLSTSEALPAYGISMLSEESTSPADAESGLIVFGQTYYALKNEDIYIHIHLDNPDGFEIVSFTLNGVKYTNYMFEPGSDLETLILKYNVGDVDGLQEYTIDAIKYIDGEAIKDVRMKGDKTVKVYVNDDTQALSFTTETEFNTLRFTPVWDDSFTGEKTIQTLALYEGEELLRELSPTDTEVTDLPMGARLILVATYQDGDTVKTLRHIVDTPKYSEGLVIDAGVITGMGTCTDTVLYLNHPIGDRAFESVSSIQNIYMGPGVTSVGTEAFSACTNLKKVVCAKETTVIGKGAFQKCESLAYVSLSAQLEAVPQDAFYLCTGLDTVIMPDGISKICAGAFNGSGIKNISIPQFVKEIEASAFANCARLESIALPADMTCVSANCFSGCTSLASVTLPNGLEVIEKEAFDQCTSLGEITIPETVTSIGVAAFRGCSALTDISLPSGLTELGASVLADCTSLTRVALPLVESTREGADTSYWNYIFGTQSVSSIPSSLCVVELLTGTFIDSYYAFTDWSSLSEIALPSTVVRIGELAFFGCSELTELRYGGSVESWTAIRKDSYWIGLKTDYSVQCTDGVAYHDPNAPLFMIRADDLSALEHTKDTAGHDLAAFELSADGSYVTIVTAGVGDPYYQFPMIDGKGYTAEVIAIKYRTTVQNQFGMVFVGSDSAPNGYGDFLNLDYVADGEWHVVLIELKDLGEPINEKGINFLRWDLFEKWEMSSMTMDMGYIAAFHSKEAALAFDATLSDIYAD